MGLGPCVAIRTLGARRLRNRAALSSFAEALLRGHPRCPWPFVSPPFRRRWRQPDDRRPGIPRPRTRQQSPRVLHEAGPTVDAVDLLPFDIGDLDVGNGHVLYYEQVGTATGPPVLYLHGGPGSGCTPGARSYVDVHKHRGVLFDQRAAGRSRPHASEEGVHWDSIDMDHHIADIEHLREHLGIRDWVVFGVSWGSVLAATYAERHPDRVRALVLGAVSTGTAADIDWLTVHAGRFFPAAWQPFRRHVPDALSHLRLADAYNWLLMDPDRPRARLPQLPGAAGRKRSRATSPRRGPTSAMPIRTFGWASRDRSRTAGDTTPGSRMTNWSATPITSTASRDASSTGGSTSEARSTPRGGSTRRGPAASSSSCLTRVTAARRWSGYGDKRSPTSRDRAGHVQFDQSPAGPGSREEVDP